MTIIAFIGLFILGIYLIFFAELPERTQGDRWATLLLETGRWLLVLILVFLPMVRLGQIIKKGND